MRARSYAATVGNSRVPAGLTGAEWRGTASQSFCALGGIRTPNLLIRSQMLYPLSYERRRAPTLPWAPHAQVVTEAAAIVALAPAELEARDDRTAWRTAVAVQLPSANDFARVLTALRSTRSMSRIL